jgi:hypothetical protein
MNNTTTHLSQLRELHQRIVNHRGHSPSRRWELWGRIHRAEQLLADASLPSPNANHRAQAAGKRTMCGRMALTVGSMAVGMVLLAVVSWLAGSHLPAQAWMMFAVGAITAATATAGFAMWGDEYGKIVELFDTAHRFEPGDGETSIEIEMDPDGEPEWVWVCEPVASEPAKAPIFGAALSLPILTAV